MKDALICLVACAGVVIWAYFSADYVRWAVQLPEVGDRVIKIGYLVIAWMLLGLGIAIVTMSSVGSPRRRQTQDSHEELHSPDMEG